MPDFNPGAAKGAPPPASFVDATGARFWGCQIQIAQGYGYAVYKAGVAQPVYFQPSGQGSLCLQPSGVLEVVTFAAPGDRQPIHAVPVPGWVAAKPATGGGGLPVRYAKALEALCKLMGI